MSQGTRRGQGMQIAWSEGSIECRGYNEKVDRPSMPCWKKKSTLYSISTWPIFLNFGKCKICARTRCSNSKSQQLFLNFSKYDWYLGPHLRRRGLCIVGTLGLDLKNQWAGFALEKRLPSISNRLRSLNPILSSAVSVHLLYPGSTGRSGLCDWQQLTSHKHAYTTWTLQFCFLISFKGFFLVVFFCFFSTLQFCGVSSVEAFHLLLLD